MGNSHVVGQPGSVLIGYMVGGGTVEGVRAGGTKCEFPFAPRESNASPSCRSPWFGQGLLGQGLLGQGLLDSLGKACRGPFKLLTNALHRG